MADFSDLDDIVEEFLVESHENLDQLDRDLVSLERDPGSRDLLASIFRTIHTIKGTSGFLAFGQLERVSHVGENLLSKLRDGKLVLDEARAGALLELVDTIRGLLASIEATGSEGDADVADLVARLEVLQAADAPVVPAPAAAAPVAEAPVAGSATAEPAEPTEPTEPAATPAEAEAKLGELLVSAGATSPVDVEVALIEQQLGDARPVGEILVEHGSADVEHVQDALHAQHEARRSVADSTIRVDVDLLDSLMRQVGELVLTRNQIVAHAAQLREPNLLRASQRLNLIASELQEGVMKTRMQPIDNVWNKLPRVVRDLGVSCGRKVRLEMEGRDTELDKTILEAIKDPLTHLVRNAVDHGVERPEDRVAAGKPAEGVLLLRAFHEGGQVNIEIVDDGAGIDEARVGAKAVERGLVSRDELARMSAREIISLIFLPGFSTAAAVTNVSGRGVGMDVVKTNIEKIGGTVDVSSVLGQGTTFKIKIPLTLAIIPALTVECGGDRYAVPQVSLLELVCLDGEQATRGIEWISGAPVHRLRGKLLPLVYLEAVLGLADEATAARPRESVFIAVLQADDRQFGLVVDRVLDTEEIVVKGLGSQLKGIGTFAGATILGDGRVALILDVLALAQRSRVLRETRERMLLDRATTTVEQHDRAAMLVVGVGEDRRVAVPLDLVTRLEEFPLSTVEHVGDREVVQYRGQILPLVRLSSYLGAYGGSGADPLQVVVYAEDGRTVGLVVDSILDITEEEVAAASDLDAAGVTGSVVVQSKVTELLDVRAAILAADPHFFDAQLSPAGVQ